MTDADLLVECKKGLSLPEDGTDFDGVLMQKILAVKSFLKGAGVSDAMLNDDLAFGVIVLGVTDIWNLTGGETRFSPAFYVMANQLAYRSQVV
jgi:hypothetical protein